MDRDDGTDDIRVSAKWARDVWAYPTKDGAAFRSGTFVLDNKMVVQGQMPFAAEMTQFWFKIKSRETKDRNGNASHELTLFPEVNLRLLRLHWTFPLKFKTPIPMTDWENLYINVYAFYEQRAAYLSVAAYDQQNGTQLAERFLAVLNESRRLLADGGPHVQRLGSTVLLHFGIVAEELFGMTRKDIQCIGFRQLVPIVKRLIANPASAFDGVFFKKPHRRATSQKYEEIESSVGGHRAETDRDQYVRGFLTLARAKALYAASPRATVVPEDLEGDDSDADADADGGAEPEHSSSSAAAKLLAQLGAVAAGADKSDDDKSDDDDAAVGSKRAPPAVGPPAKKPKKAPKKAVMVPLFDGSKYAWLASNPVRCRVPQPSLRELDDGVWILQAVKEMVMEAANDKKDAFVEKADLLLLAKNLRAMLDFPVVDVTVEMVYAAVSDGVRRGVLAAGNMATWDWWSRCLNRADRVPDGKGLADIAELAVAREHIFRREYATAYFFKKLYEQDPVREPQLLRPQLAAHNRGLLQGDPLRFFPSGFELHEKQREAFVRGVTHPVTVIHGPSGVGKSTVLEAILRFHVKSGNAQTIWITAFKNDTVAKMRIAYKDIAPETIITRVGVTGDLQRIHTTKATNDDLVEHPYPHFVYSTCDMLRTLHKDGANLRCSVLLADEVAVMGTEMIADVMSMIDINQLQHAVFAGDKMQLPPIQYGAPFKLFVQYPWAIELTRDYRSASSLLRDNLTKIRAMDAKIEFGDHFRVDMLPWRPDDPSSPYYLRFSAHYMGIVAEKMMVAVERAVAEMRQEAEARAKESGEECTFRDIDAYGEIRVLSPYNDVCKYLNEHLRARFFGGAVGDDAYSRTMSKESRDFDSNKAKWQRDPLQIGERVVVKETEPENEIYRGHISTIKYIMDRPFRALREDKALDLEKMNEKYGVSSTAGRLGKDLKRTVYLTSGTVIPLNGTNSSEYLQSASAHTIYRSQGDQYRYCIVVLPPGQVADNPNIYTAVGRTIHDVTIIAPKQLLIDAITTPGRVPRSLVARLISTYVNANTLDNWNVGIVAPLAPTA